VNRERKENLRKVREIGRKAVKKGTSRKYK
jgi:hypothetical protein